MVGNWRWEQGVESGNWVGEVEGWVTRMSPLDFESVKFT